MKVVLPVTFCISEGREIANRTLAFALSQIEKPMNSIYSSALLLPIRCWWQYGKNVKVCQK